MEEPTAARYLASTLQAYGVSAVFLVPTILSRTLYEMERYTAIRRIVTHGEKAAAYMADGYARATGRPGVCMAQNIGAANLAAGLRDPFLGLSPVLALTGGPYERSRGRSYYQEIEDFPLFKPVTKTSTQVLDAARLPDLLAQAFRVMTAGKSGPAHLELAGHAGDTLEDQLLDLPVPDGPVQAVPLHRAPPAPESVSAVLAALLAAERPVIVSGGGVRSSGAGAELRALAERLGIPVATSLNSKAALPGGHPLNVGVPGLYARPSANHVLLEADLVCYVGSQTGSQVTMNWQVPTPGTLVVQIDIEPTELGRHYPRTVPMLCDAKLGLQALLDAVGAADTGEDAAAPRRRWAERAAELGRRWRGGVQPLFESDDVPIRPERLCAELSRHLPGDALVVSDTGHSGIWTGAYLDLNGPGHDYVRAAGSLGWGLPAAIGAQLGAPERPVVLFSGDGGFWYHIAELETAARWKVPATFVVNNNSALNQEINPYTAAYGGELHGRHGELWHFRDTSFAAVAESMGALGITVTKPSQFAGALERAIAHPGPAVVDVVTDMNILPARAPIDPAAT